MPEDADGHNYGDSRFFDSETKQWGYEIVCWAHVNEEGKCPREGVMFVLGAERQSPNPT